MSFLKLIISVPIAADINCSECANDLIDRLSKQTKLDEAIQEKPTIFGYKHISRAVVLFPYQRNRDEALLEWLANQL